MGIDELVDIYSYRVDDKINSFFISSGVLLLLQKILFTVLIIFLGFFIIKRLDGLIRITLQKYVQDETFEKFFVNLINNVLKCIVIIIGVGTLGVELTSIIALLGAVGFAIGLAFQGALSNFAGGILLIVLRPFIVGEFIEAEDIKGVVEELSILNTTIITVDNKVVTIPNGKLSNGNIINYSRKEKRRVDIDFYASYGDDVEKVINVIKNVVNTNDLILKDNEIFVEVSCHGDSSITYTTRVWVKSADYWTVYFYLMKNVKIAFDKENIEIPFQKIDITMNK